jgi:hypothetical protein
MGELQRGSLHSTLFSPLERCTLRSFKVNRGNAVKIEYFIGARKSTLRLVRVQTSLTVSGCNRWMKWPVSDFQHIRRRERPTDGIRCRLLQVRTTCGGIIGGHTYTGA